MTQLTDRQQQQQGRSLTLAVSGAANNGSGLVRLTTTPATRLLRTGDKVLVVNVGGVAAANSTWTVTAISATQTDLQGSTFSGVYTSGGTMKRLG